MKERPNCLKCQYFYSTWEPDTPKGCKFYGFKTRHIPSLVVKKESGQDCQGYSPKKGLHKKKELDLNDESLW